MKTWTIQSQIGSKVVLQSFAQANRGPILSATESRFIKRWRVLNGETNWRKGHSVLKWSVKQDRPPTQSHWETDTQHNETNTTIQLIYDQTHFPLLMAETPICNPLETFSKIHCVRVCVCIASSYLVFPHSHRESKGLGFSTDCAVLCCGKWGRGMLLSTEWFPMDLRRECDLLGAPGTLSCKDKGHSRPLGDTHTRICCCCKMYVMEKLTHTHTWPLTLKRRHTVYNP